MSVFTTLTREEVEKFLLAYPCGELLDYAGIVAGTHNTNYSIYTTRGHYVLTLFEDFNAAELIPVIHFINHLATHQLPIAAVMLTQNDECLQIQHGKPIVLAQWLDGEHPSLLNKQQCANLGTFLGKMHRLSEHYPLTRANFRGREWRHLIAERVMSKLNTEEATLLASELAWQQQLDFSQLPQGIIHADLFRDNILFSNQQLTGVIDIYNACSDVLLLDVAIAVNDCCLDETTRVNKDLADTLLCAYKVVHPLTPAEKKAWPAILRFAALTFWLLRLHAKLFPVVGKIVFQKNPDEYMKILQQHRESRAG